MNESWSFAHKKCGAYVTSKVVNGHEPIEQRHQDIVQLYSLWKRVAIQRMDRFQKQFGQYRHKVIEYRSILSHVVVACDPFIFHVPASAVEYLGMAQQYGAAKFICVDHSFIAMAKISFWRDKLPRLCTLSLGPTRSPDPDDFSNAVRNRWVLLLPRIYSLDVSLRNELCLRNTGVTNV